MTEQTDPTPSETAAAPSALPAGFGGRTDSHAGLSLGLAPTGLSRTGQVSDDSAPDGLADGLADASSVATQVVGVPTPSGPKEHWFSKQMREAAEAHAALLANNPDQPAPAAEPAPAPAETAPAPAPDAPPPGAVEHRTAEAREKYLEAHPDADPDLHVVIG